MKNKDAIIIYKKPLVLMYHSVGAPGPCEVGAELYCVNTENFRKQMEYISKVTRSLPTLRSGQAGHQVTSSQNTKDEEREKKDDREGMMEDGQEKRNHRPLTIDHRPIVITFDDGLLDNYTNAYPILKELGLKAYFFILASKIGTEGFMNWEQIKELKSAGMYIGSHGMTHRILTELNDADMEYELRKSKQLLEKNLACSSDYLSIPRGFYNQKVIAKAKEAGYKAIFTSNPKDNDGFTFGRIAVKGNWDTNYFIRVTKKGLSLKDKTKELLKNTSKKILGAKTYDTLRTTLLKPNSTS